MTTSTRFASLLTAAVALPIGTGAWAQRPQSTDPVVGRIQPAWIAPHVRFLASDLLRGRDTGTPGAELAARYVAAEFGRLGLVPLDRDSSYLLPVPLRQSTVVEESTSLTLTTSSGATTLVLGTDYLVHPAKNDDSVATTGGVVFVGFGVTAPEAGYDDYRGVDARGKFAAMVFGGPGSLPPDERGHYAGLAEKERNARAHGAVGIITLLPAPGSLIAEKFGQLEGFGWLDQGGTAHSPFFEVGPAIRLTDRGTTALLAIAGQPLATIVEKLARGPHSFPIDATIAFRSSFRQRPVTGYNAAAVLPGRDPGLRDEYVVFSAHLDHVGTRAPVEGDSIYHGAIDNAGGTASMMAIARAMTELPRPRRSILFLAVTGEEKGILGSDYFVHAPPVPRERLVADVNLDNFVMTVPTRDLVAYGAKYSTLDQEVGRMLGRLGLAASDDPLPGMTIFTRSDHYSFMRAGIPGVMFFAGKLSGSGSQDGVAVMQAWFNQIHHSPRDRYQQPIDWGAGVRYSEANMSIGYAIANRTERPRWRGRYFFHAPEARIDQTGSRPVPAQ